MNCKRNTKEFQRTSENLEAKMLDSQTGNVAMKPDRETL